MVVFIEDLKNDCGEVYDNLNNGTTAAYSLLEKSKTKIIALTGTTSGFDLPIRNLANAYICNQVLGSTQATDQSVGIIRVGRKQIIVMFNNFIEECNNSLALQGYILNYKNAGFEVVNQ